MPRLRLGTIGMTELGYAEDTTDLSVTSSAGTDVTGCVVTVNVGARPILLVAHAVVYSTGAGDQTILGIFEGATAIKTDQFTSITANALGFVHIERELRTPTPGSHTYKLVARHTPNGVGTSHVFGTAGTNQQGPTTLRVVQL